MQLPFDQTAEADRVCALIVAAHPQLRARVVTTTLADRTYARIYLGNGVESYLYQTLTGGWRMSAPLPLSWRRALAATIGEESIDRAPGRGGLLPPRKRAP